MGPYVEQGPGQFKSVALRDGSMCQTITSKRNPGSIREEIHCGITIGTGLKKRLTASNMAMYGGILIPFLLTALYLMTWALATAESTNITKTDRLSEDESDIEDEDAFESRNDLDDLSDDVLRSFFDFTSTEGDNEENSSEPPKVPSAIPKPYSKYYPQQSQYYNEKNSYYAKKPYHYPRYPSSYHRPLPYFAKGHVTPGSHYKYGTHKSIGDKMFDDSKQHLNASQIVGPYQISVVDANSPLLSSLGLKRHHLEKLSGSPIPVSTYSSGDQLAVSDSVPSPSYAEHPRHQHSDHGPYHNPSPPYSSGYEHSKGPYPPPQGAVPPPNYYHPAHHDQQSHQYQNNPPPPPQNHPPPQRSYLPPHTTYKEQYSNPANGPKYNYNSPPNVQPTQYSPEAWRPSSDGYEKEHDRSKDNSNYNRGAWQQPSAKYPPHPPPLPHSHTYSRPITYVSPATKSVSSSYPYPKYGSSNYHKPTYSGSSPSTSKSTPERAGSASYDSYHSHHSSPPAKPSITVRFKSKAPQAGISIPINFNPLEVVKKLAMPLASLNPLANKKVTIGITIENKNQAESYHSHPHYR